MQLLELLFFAVVAFLIISKLIATLGTTDEEEASRYKSYFGEKGAIKDVTGSAEFINPTNQKDNSVVNNDNLDDLIDQDNKTNIVENLVKLRSRLTSFNPIKFLRGATSAFKMIINSASSKDYKTLTPLIDKRYLEQFKELSFDSLKKPENLNAKISDLYMFGNNVFIKILFSGSNIFSSSALFKQEWTFSKSLIVEGPDWYLSNVDPLT